MLSPEFQKAFQLAAKMERKPIEMISQNKGQIDNKLKLFHEFSQKVNDIKKLAPQFLTPYGLQELKLGSSDPNVLAGAVDKTKAIPGHHLVEVSQLASHASALSNGFPDKDGTHVGTGYITVTTATGEEKEIFVDQDNATLEGVAKLINEAHVSLTASVVRDESDPENPYRLLVTTREEGGRSSVTYPEFYLQGGDSDFYIEKEHPAQDAVLKYDGMEIRSPNNEIRDVIPGVSLDLKGLSSPGHPVTLTIDRDIPQISGKIKGLMQKVNDTLSFIQTQNHVSPGTPLDKTLSGDFGLRLTEERLMRSLQTHLPFDDPSKVKLLSDIGVQFNRNGTLDIDDKKLEFALSAHYDDTVNFLLGDKGMINTLFSSVNSITRSGDGILSSETQMLERQATQLQKEMDTKEEASKRNLEALKLKLGQAQESINRLQNQTAALGGIGSATISGIPTDLIK